LRIDEEEEEEEKEAYGERVYVNVDDTIIHLQAATR